MGFFGFVGRLAFAFIFISGGLQKLQTFDQLTGGPIVINGVTPAMEKFISDVSTLIEQPINFEELKPFMPQMFAAACGLEVVGGALFVLGSRFGAFLLITFLVIVTPVMHAFWLPDLSEEDKMTEMVSFFKNVALAGALLTYMDMKGAAKVAARKAKTD